MERPARDFAQAFRIEHVLQWISNEARPPTSRLSLMVTRRPAGQVTLLVSRSTSSRSLVNSPMALRTGDHLAETLQPCCSTVHRVAPSA